jgi:hypothetical protein
MTAKIYRVALGPKRRPAARLHYGGLTYYLTGRNGHAHLDWNTVLDYEATDTWFDDCRVFEYEALVIGRGVDLVWADVTGKVLDPKTLIEVVS